MKKNTQNLNLNQNPNFKMTSYLLYNLFENQPNKENINYQNDFFQKIEKYEKSDFIFLKFKKFIWSSPELINK